MTRICSQLLLRVAAGPQVLSTLRSGEPRLLILLIPVGSEGHLDVTYPVCDAMWAPASVWLFHVLEEV